MYRGYKIVANSAAGRRRYMQWLVPYVIACEEIDRYDIWIHTHNGADIEFFKQLAGAFPKVNLVWQPNGEVKNISTINPFYRFCCEDKTIYIKLDDDIVWMENDTLRKLIDFRIDHPEYFLISPLVINNAQSTYLLQVCNKIHLNTYYKSHADGDVLWRSGKFAADLHQWFLDNYLKTGRYTELHVGAHPTAMTRFSINSILWFGEDLQAIKGEIPGDDEEFMSCIYPTRLGKANCFLGDTIMAHFAFFTQREQLDKQNILKQYGETLDRIWKTDEIYRPIHERIQTIVKNIDTHETELMKRPSPYTHGTPDPVYKLTIRNRLFTFLPKSFQKAWELQKKEKHLETTQYILSE